MTCFSFYLFSFFLLTGEQEGGTGPAGRRKGWVALVGVGKGGDKEEQWRR
jgi:hypothetical protein